MLLSPIHCCDVTKPPYLLSGELCTSPLLSNRLYVYTVCCRRGGQCFSVLRTCHTDVVGDSSGRSYITKQGHNVPLLRTRGLACHEPSPVHTHAIRTMGMSLEWVQLTSLVDFLVRGTRSFHRKVLQSVWLPTTNVDIERRFLAYSTML